MNEFENMEEARKWFRANGFKESVVDSHLWVKDNDFWYLENAPNKYKLHRLKDEIKDLLDESPR